MPSMRGNDRWRGPSRRDDAAGKLTLMAAAGRVYPDLAAACRRGAEPAGFFLYMAGLGTVRCRGAGGGARERQSTGAGAFRHSTDCAPKDSAAPSESPTASMMNQLRVGSNFQVAADHGRNSERNVGLY
ncbi:hypothetical protein [Lysobacter gummosus]|uniref:hypothetical protein n=1 Tax=Lysobacter gummosus TaxID=262324 RepID=UPI00362BAFA1